MICVCLFHPCWLLNTHILQNVKDLHSLNSMPSTPPRQRRKKGAGAENEDERLARAEMLPQIDPLIHQMLRHRSSSSVELRADRGCGLNTHTHTLPYFDTALKGPHILRWTSCFLLVLSAKSHENLSEPSET